MHEQEGCLVKACTQAAGKAAGQHTHIYKQAQSDPWRVFVCVSMFGYCAGMRKKGSWFRLLGRQQDPSGGGTNSAVSGITSSSSQAAAGSAGAGSSSRSEQRSGMMQLLTGGPRSDEQGSTRTGLLSSLVQNK